MDPTSLPKRIVWFIWVLMSIALLGYVARFSHNLPYYDDWNLVPLLDGSIKVDAHWLWLQHNAHRIPFPKLVLFSLLSLTGWDFRSGMFLNAFALISITAMLLRTASRIRGFTSYTDLFFPLFLLHWGNFDYLLWNWQLNQMIPVIIVLAILCIMLTQGLNPGTRALILSSIGIVLLPLSGVNGLAYVPGLAIWLLLAGVRWREGTPALYRFAAVSSGALSLILIPIYFRGLHPTKKYGGEMISLLERSLANLPGLASTTAHFVTQGLGLGAFVPFTSIVLSLFILICLAGLLKTAKNEVSALLFLIGIAGLVGAVSISLIYTTTFPSRYGLQAAPIFCWMFLVSVRCKEWFPSKLVQFALVLLSAVVLYGNSARGLEYAHTKDQQFSKLEADIQDGIPPSQLIARHQRAIFPYPEKGGTSFHDSLAGWFEILRNAKHVTFANLGKDPVFREAPLESFAGQRFVYGIRVTGYPLNTERWQMKVSWGPSPSQRCYYWNPPPNPQDQKFEQFTCWVYEDVRDIQLEVIPAVERSLKVSLLVR